MLDNSKMICKICGLKLIEPYLYDNEIFPNESIWTCPCCGENLDLCTIYNSIGYIRKKRESRFYFGHFKYWYEESLKPTDWDLLEQLKQIPEEFDPGHALELYQRCKSWNIPNDTST